MRYRIQTTVEALHISIQVVNTIHNTILTLPVKLSYDGINESVLGRNMAPSNRHDGQIRVKNPTLHGINPRKGSKQGGRLNTTPTGEIPINILSTD